MERTHKNVTVSFHAISIYIYICIHMLIGFVTKIPGLALALGMPTTCPVPRERLHPVGAAEG